MILHWNANLLAHLLNWNVFGFYIQPRSYVIVYLCFISEKKKNGEKHQVWLNEVASERKKKTILISYTNDHFLWYEKFLAIQMTATFYFFFLSIWYSWRHKNLCVAFSKRRFVVFLMNNFNSAHIQRHQRYAISEMKNVRVCTECHLQRKKKKKFIFSQYNPRKLSNFDAKNGWKTASHQKYE